MAVAITLSEALRQNFIYKNYEIKKKLAKEWFKETINYKI